MKKNIEKFIAEYEQKISDMYILLKENTQCIIDARRKGQDPIEEKKERAVLWAKRQAYIQARVDFESLWDLI